ncbi:MAG: sugar ABC transporter permease YjfF [Spirochaetaceae bacterium]|jgi:simple sugar transport system permease protein|nr:sugar ABC transporter permease YjfF [Spirochaetaceae bacterium]
MKKLNFEAFVTKYLSVAAATLLFFIAFIFGSVSYRGFFDVQTFLNLFIDKAYLIISALGMTLVILSGGIDLSVGSVVALTTMIISALTEFAHLNPFIAILVAVITGGAIGFLMGCIIAYWNVPPFIATLAGMFFARGACYLISIQSISISEKTLSDLAIWKLRFGSGAGVPFISLNVILTFVMIVAVIYVSLHTKFGRNIYAIGGNEQSAVLLGIPVRKTKIAIYTVNGFCSAVAGVVFSLYMLSGYGLHGQGMEMDVIAAVVIGGTLLSGGVGYVYGSVFGSLTIAIIQALIMFNGRINSWWTKITVGVLLLLFIGLQRFIVAVGNKKN